MIDELRTFWSDIATHLENVSGFNNESQQALHASVLRSCIGDLYYVQVKVQDSCSSSSDAQSGGL